MPWDMLPSDGVTPVCGRVAGLCHFGDIVTISGKFRGLLPRPAVVGCGDIADLPRHTKGQQVTVYINGRNTDTQKLKLSLEPSARHLLRVANLICDGRHPYPARVKKVEGFGAFIDIGCERMAFLPKHRIQDDLREGDNVTAYVTRRCAADRIVVSLTQTTRPLLNFKDVVADGQTPYQGVVEAVEGDRVFVDISCEMVPTLQLKSGQEFSPSLAPGAALTVYVVRKERREKKLRLSLEPRETPIMQLKDLAVDGQTPYTGVVQGWRSRSNSTLVDIGCEELVVLPGDDPLTEASRLVTGAQVTVYVTSRSCATGRVIVSSVRRSRRLMGLAEVMADGSKPYDATVSAITPYGTFFNWDFEAPGMMMHDCRTAPLKVGDNVKVYIWHRNAHLGRVYVKLHPRERPAVPLRQLLADGVTPVDATVIAQRGYIAFLDVGCENLAVLKEDEFGIPKGEIERLHVGESLRVYVRRKNLVAERVTVALHPDPAPRIALQEIQMGAGHHKGIIVSIQYRSAFVDIACDTAGYFRFEETSAEKVSVGDEVYVCPLAYDESTGYLQVQRISAGSCRVV